MGERTVPRNLWTQSMRQSGVLPIPANSVPCRLRISDSAFGELLGLGTSVSSGAVLGRNWRSGWNHAGGGLPGVILSSAEGSIRTPWPMAGARSHLRQAQSLLRGEEAVPQTGTGPAQLPARQVPCWADPLSRNASGLGVRAHKSAHNPVGVPSMAAAKLGVGHVGGCSVMP